MVSDQPVEWVSPRPDDALTFLAAGSVTERLFLNHSVENGDDGDILMYRRGMKLFDPTPVSELEIQWRRGQTAAEQLIRANDKAFLRVYMHVVGRVPQDGHGGHLGFDEPLIVSFEDVREAVVNAA